MIGVDTNVLIRAVLEDDEKQAKIAKKFLAKTTKEKKLFISSYAILEMAWVLKVNKCSREEISEAILDLIDSPGITVGQRDVITEAIELYNGGKSDFGDCLITAEGRQNRSLNLASFDVKFCKDITTAKSPKSFL